MAYVDDSLLEDDQQNQQGGPSLGNSGAPSSAAPSAASKSPQQKTPGNFANLSEYLRVNQPQQFGQQVAGKIGGEIDQGNQAVDQASDQFKQRVDANTVKDQNNLTGQVANDPTQVDQGQFAKLRDASYAGPKSLADAQDLNSQVQGAAGTAVGKAGASQSEGGRFALLDSYFGRPNYSQGQKSLDNLLIQSDPGSQQAFQGVQQRAQDLSSKTKSLDPSLQSYAGLGAQQTADTRKGARNAVGIDDQGNLSASGPIQDIYKTAQQTAQNQNTQNQSAYQAEVADAGKNKYGLNPEFLKAMGLDPSVSNGLGVDASKYLTASGAVSPEQALTADQASRARALQGLAGGVQTPFSSLDQAGTGASNPFTFNKEGYLNERNTNEQAMNSEVGAQDKLKDKTYADWVAEHPSDPTATMDPNHPLYGYYQNKFNTEQQAYQGRQAQIAQNRQAILDKYLKGVGA